MDAVGVVVLGLGNIGGAVARALINDAMALETASGVRLRLVGGFARDSAYGARAGIDPGLVWTDAIALVDHPDARVVVETLGGEQPASALMCHALAAGRHVVTANKEAVAKQLPGILAAARDGDAGLMLEACVGGGIPLLVALRQVLAANRVERIRGIVNGTTNFILSKMDEEGADYASALAEAQRLGYAEADPTADVEGFDAAYKLTILASLALGRYIALDSVDRAGISGVTAADIASARARGGTIRLIASMERSGDDTILRVAPTFVAGDDLFARVVRNFNAVEIVGDRVGPVWLHGQGAGPDPTSSAILSDIIEVVRSGSAATPRVTFAT